MPSSTFTNGTQITTIKGQNIVVNDFLVKSDGSYVLFGAATSAAGSVFITSRYSSNGVLDSKFGTKGIVTTDFDTRPNFSDGLATAIGINISEDNYGRLFAVGSYIKTTPGASEMDAYNHRGASVLYNNDGSINSALWPPMNGLMVMGAGFASLWGVEGLITNNDRRITIFNQGAEATFDGSGGYSKIMVRAQKPDANPDPSFGDYGGVEIDFGVPAAASGGLLLKNGGILLFGLVKSASANMDMAFVRLNNDGSRDKNFSGDGLLTIDFKGGLDGILGAVEQDDGKIVAVGTVMKDSKSGAAVVRLNKDGTPDSSFGISGIAAFFSAGNSEATGVHLNKDGSLLISGYATNQTKADFLIIKLDKSGLVDTTFGQNGIVHVDFSNGSDKASGVYQLSDGKIIIGGETTSESGIGSFALVRLNSDGSFDKSFNGTQTFTGTSVAETFTSTSGDDLIDGGNGIDTVVFSVNRSHYTVINTSSGWIVSSESDGVDTLSNVERLKFSDTAVALDITGNAGITAKTLGVTFGKATISNKEYVGIGLKFLDDGMSYTDLMQIALTAAGASTNTKVVNLLWTNLFGAAPTFIEASPYLAMLDSDSISAGALGVLAADLSLNATNIDLVGLQQTGIEYSVF